MKTPHATLSARRLGSAMTLLWLLVNGGNAKAVDYIFNPTGSTNVWTTTTIWTPNGTPGSGDNIDATLIGSGGATLTVGVSTAGGITRTIGNVTKTVANRWNIYGNTTTLTTLNVNNINISTDNMAFGDGNTGGLVVNAANINVSSGGGLYFGVTGNAPANLSRGLTVSGTTTLTGTGFLRMNVVNPSGSSYSLGLLNVSSTAVVTLANAPTGKAATIGNVTGLNGSAGFIQSNLAITQIGNIATLAVTNATDYSSATVLRDGIATTHGGTLLLTKAGAGTQTLSGVNTYTGATTITNGTLKLGNASALGARTGIVPTNTDNGTNVSATGTLDLGGQAVTEVIRLNGTGFGGNGALVNSGAAASISSGIASITQTTTGTTAPTLTITGGGGTGATATATMAVTSTTFTINGGTTTYSVAPTVTISGGGASTQATATAILNGSGVVTGITIASVGAGYTSAPTIAFSAGTMLVAGTNPTGTGNATNFVATGYSITATGSGYTSAPTVSFSNGAFAATTTLSGIVLAGNSSIGGSGDITVSGVVSESGGARVLTKVGTNTLTLGNAGNSYSGATIINGGAVGIGADAALGTAPVTATPAHLTLNGGTLATTADVTLNANRGLSLGASGGTVDVAASTTLSYGGVIADGGGLTKTNTGTLSLTAANTYTGATAINAGTVTISHATALGTAASGTTVASGGTLALSGGITVMGEALALTGDGIVTGVGALRNVSGANTWAGNISSSVATRINADAGSLLISGNITSTSSGNFTIGGAGDLEVSGVISGPLPLFKASVGAGTLTLSNAANTYTGITTIAQGTVKVSSEGNLGTTPGAFVSNSVRLRGGALQTTADMSLSATRGVLLSNGGGGFNTDTATTLTVNGVISGTTTDNLAKTGGGTLVMKADNTYAGATDITAGSLQVGLSGVGKSGTGAITARSGSTILGTGTVQGSAFTAESGAIIHAGDGTAQSDYGTLSFTPASGSGAIDFQSGSTTFLGINPGGTSDLISIVGTGTNTLLFNGNLTVGPAAFTPTMAEVFNLLDWTNLVAGPTFASRYSYTGPLFGNGDEVAGFDLPDVSGSGYFWNIGSFTTNGSISLQVVPEPSRALLLLLGLAGLLTRRRR